MSMEGNKSPPASTTNADPQVYHGQCLCGSVQFEATGPLKFCVYCHCSICQRFSGAEVTAFAAVAVDNLVLVQGEVTPVHTSPRMIRYRCVKYGSPTFNESLLAQYAFNDFPLGCLVRDSTGQVPAAVREALVPTRHLNYEMRVRDWTEDSLPKFRGMMEGQLDAAGNELLMQQGKK